MLFHLYYEFLTQRLCVTRENRLVGKKEMDLMCHTESFISFIENQYANILFSLGDIRKSKWYLFESRFHENCVPLDVNKHEKYVLFSTAMKLLFFQLFENHLLARILFLVDMTEPIVTAFDNYYSNVFQGFFCDRKLGNSAVFGSPKRIHQFLMT